MAVSLYTVRVVLNVLGAEDYGIYNVVAGVVTMFGFLSGAMATASQRYFSFDIGKGDFDSLKASFSVSILIHVIVGIVMVLLGESFGVWFIRERLVIPYSRFVSAQWVYQFAIISFVFTVITAPFMALIIAYEDMTIYAYVSIVECALRLCIALFIQFLPTDTLISYGFLMLLVTIVNTSIYRLICRKKYKLRWYPKLCTKKKVYEMFSFVGWNMFGASIGIFKVQLVNILLNQYFGPIVNTSRGLANQVNNALMSFSQNFSTALKPQIIKQYAIGKQKELLHLVFQGCKCIYFLTFLFTLPLIVETDFVLHLWLKEIPVYTVDFTRLVLLDALIDSISYPMMSAVQATGKIRLYQCVISGIQIANFPLAWICLSLQFEPTSVSVVAVSLGICCLIARLCIMHGFYKYSVLTFLQTVILRILIVTGLSFASVFAITAVLPTTIFFSFINLCLAFVITFTICILFGFDKQERHGMYSIIKQYAYTHRFMR